MQEGVCLCQSGCRQGRGYPSAFHQVGQWFDFQIDQILYKCRATSKKVGGGGIRYTVMIKGKESFLFHEGDKWFVEAKENAQ